MPRLSKNDWTAAALAALAEGGVPAVAIEPLAARVGATKGSAYWHFPNREALLEATLRRWETEHAGALAELVEADRPPPVERLRRLLGAVLDAARPDHVELALLASADEPLVAAALRRVTERRLSYLARLFGQLGFTPAQARRRAVLAHSLYLGQAQLVRGAPEVLPRTSPARRAQLDDAVRTMTAPPA
ncbi:MAG TPA: TetR/AcrR family transcriptional regulator [Actinophytocola sp.]|uniref:TetR/AcrR family transcriptional regulator n=1 Tax=Actinophytocola sp. TaxID=1872138 RepID=UPI002DDD871B|nr:TetR/AcrR family transcriptional regulator [Actinophytocola sp.]HEV2781972.1 TetR/AcrR family transcriptional regulator [Actinophytocola sp.]